MRGRFALRHCSTVRGFFTMANPKPEIISRAMFAARRSVKPKTVDRWIALGRISGKALTRDGKIVVAEAEGNSRLRTTWFAVWGSCRERAAARSRCARKF
jgi:hypothetical protein